MTAPAPSARPECLAIVPARGGSKGVPHKNRRLLNGRPLVDYTFSAAQDSRYITRCLLTTDCEQIAQLGQQANVDVPFLRPANLATDAAPTLGVVRHALEFLEVQEGYQPDVVVLLQPTAPLRQPEHIDGALETLFASDADSVVSVTKVAGHYNPDWQFQIMEGQLRLWNGRPLKEVTPRRQMLADSYTRNGAIYGFSTAMFMSTGSLYGESCVPFVMAEEDSVNIDTLADWELAERQLQTISQQQKLDRAG